MLKYIIGFLVAIIIVLLFNYYNIYQKEYEKYMFGYWIADESYCEDAGAREMMIFIGEAKKSKYNPFAQTERVAHLIINDDITNQVIKIRYKPASSGYSCSLGKYAISANIEYEEECIIPAAVTIEIDIHRGTLKIYSDGIIYGLFHKIHDITNIFGKCDGSNPLDAPANMDRNADVDAACDGNSDNITNNSDHNITD